MNLYNMVNGFNPACVIVMPMLGRKQEEWPRFRDCFISEDSKYIDIYTRVGGGNRGCGYGEEELYKDKNFVETFDDPFDSTYATYRFTPPKKWQKDFKHIANGEFTKVSDEYVKHVKDFYPLIAANGIIDELFRSETSSREEKGSE